MSTGGSRKRQERANQVGTPAGKQSVRMAASFGPTARISPNSAKRGQGQTKGK